jgi:putative endonuclease
MFTVYVLQSFRDGKRYIGYTSDLVRRLHEHAAGKTKSTKRRRPFELIYFEEYDDADSAKRRERFFKSGKGREELKRILSGAVPKW